ncbi:hypothetical protein BG004_007635, partial [Podila humilis]
MLTARTSYSSASLTSTFPGEKDTPVRLRIHISHAKDLASKDINGYSDPYIKVSLGGHRFTTAVVRKSLNPTWDTSFDFDIEPQSTPDEVRFMVWDKDWVSKDDFMGCVIIPLDSASIWADAVPRHFDDTANKPMWHALSSIPGKSSRVSGEVEIKFGFIDSVLSPATSKSSLMDCHQVWESLVNGRNKLGLGQRQVVFSGNASVTLGDIPMAGDEVDPTLGFGNMSLDDSSSSSSSLLLSKPKASISSDLHGLVFMEVVSANNLPKLHNVTRTGFDMDPFVIVSFGKYIFRTRVIRHSLNPVWNGKIMFKVRKGEEKFEIKYSVHDWDKMSGNDHLGTASINVKKLIADADSQEASTATTTTTNNDNDNDVVLSDYQLKINIDSKIKAPAGEATINIRAKFVSYAGLRRRFWLGLANSYNVGQHKGSYNKVLVQTMLEELGSNLSNKTIDAFWTPYNKNPEHDELSFDELFEQLEKQVRLDDSSEGAHDGSYKPEEKKKKSRLSWFTKRRTTPSSPTDSGVKECHDENEEEGDNDEESTIDDSGEEHMEQYIHVTRNMLPTNHDPEAVDMHQPQESDFDPKTSEHEHVIRISTCPICHDRTLGTLSETDVITHIAICSSTDGFSMDKLILGNFVTEANAQRKWVTKVVQSLGYGRYVAGKSNANIIVQDRATGAMVEEKMPTFIRLGIRLLYKSPANKMSVGKILADMSRKQGLKFDDPRSVRDIEPFIRFHELQSQMPEVLEPIENFKSFNEFFYRKLKPDARVLASPKNNKVAVSVADCRMSCFQTISDATKFWIKGRQFTIGKLLGEDDDSSVLASKYDGGALAIFRLAPQDYHRYHIPVKGLLSEPKFIDGEYYTVNPMAIRSELDVYGENKRVVSTITSKEFGTVAYVAIGAMMVGSIVLTTKGGQAVERMDEHGYFAF